MYDQAEPWFKQCLDITRDRFGESPPDVATSLYNLAKLYYYQSKCDKAGSLYVEALEIRKQLLGASHPDVATSLNGLAENSYCQGKPIKMKPKRRRLKPVATPTLNHLCEFC